VDDEELRLRATGLRERGMTLRQVRRELGIAVDHLTRILAGGPRIDLRRERDKSEELCRAAKLLRSRGRTYQQIAMELGLASSTVGVWCRDVDDAVTGRSGPERRAVSVRRAAHRREAHRQQALLEGAREIGHLSERELMLLGMALYWAEGAKSKPWRLAERIVFVNSDPTMVNVFLRWLELMGVEPARRTFRLQIHDSADADAAVAYWAELIGVSPQVFGTTSLKRHNPKTVRKNVGECYRGCLRIEVRRSAELYRRVAGAWFGIVDASRRLPPRAP
jgi:transposase-like protein